MTDRPDKPIPPRKPPRPTDEEHERERLEPGLNTGGKGDVGGRPGGSNEHDNSNT